MRTFNRDRGNDNFKRLEIYLDDKLRRECKQPAKTRKSAQDGFEGVRTAITLVQNPSKPTAVEKELIWAQVMQAIESLMLNRMNEKTANKAALNFLNEEVLFMAKNATALRAAFYRKLKAFKESGGHLSAIKDQRRERSGNRRAPKLSEDDRLNILAYTARAGGRLS